MGNHVVALQNHARLADSVNGTRWSTMGPAPPGPIGIQGVKGSIMGWSSSRLYRKSPDGTWEFHLWPTGWTVSDVRFYSPASGVIVAHEAGTNPEKAILA